jgi:hypothetical protein
MPLTVPLKNPGDQFTSSEFNEMLNALNDFVDSNFNITLSQLIDLSVNGTQTISVQANEPSSPQTNDVWIDIS